MFCLSPRKKSEEKREESHRRISDGGNQQATFTPPVPSYAQVVSPPQLGVKRTTSERIGLSPEDCCPKRSFRFKGESPRDEAEQTPPNTMICCQNATENETPDYSTHYCNGGVVQRRLFASPKTGQLTPVRPALSNRYVADVH